MIRRNGGQLVANCFYGRRPEMTRARAFFEVFWRWSVIGCQAARRDAHRSLHTSSSRKSSGKDITENSVPKPLIERPSASQTSASPSEEDLSSRAESPLSTTVRLLMRTLPHSVVVITTSKFRLVNPSLAPRRPKSVKSTTPDDYHGMTISSFTTVTLAPEPIISFNVKLPSQTLATLERTENFLVHILEANKKGARIADAFTRGSKEARKVLLGGLRGLEIGQVGFKLNKNKFDAPELVLPLLRGGGVSRVLRCEVLARKGKIGGFVKVGDHMLVIAKVVEVLDSEGKEQDEGGEGRSGLCYADGTYRRVGDIIEIKEDEVNGRRGEKDKRTV